MASIQSDAVQLALDLLVTHPDLRGFFRMFIKRLVDDSEAHACGVWLLDEATGACDLWMANIGGETFTPESADWASLDLPRESMSRHLAACEEGRDGDPRIRRRRRAVARSGARVQSRRRRERAAGRAVAAAAEDARLDRVVERAGFRVRAALAACAARRDGAAGDAGALLQPPLRTEPARSAPSGGARRAQPDRARHSRHARPGIRRHSHAVAGGAARRRLEPAGGGGAQPRDGGRSRTHASHRGASIGGGAAAAVRRTRGRADGAAPHGRSRAAHQRRAGRARDRRAAGIRRRRRARDHRHRPGSAHQRRPPRARPAHRRARRRGARRRIPPVGRRRWPRHQPAIAAPQASA